MRRGSFGCGLRPLIWVCDVASTTSLEGRPALGRALAHVSVSTDSALPRHSLAFRLVHIDPCLSSALAARFPCLRASCQR